MKNDIKDLSIQKGVLELLIEDTELDITENYSDQKIKENSDWVFDKERTLKSLLESIESRIEYLEKVQSLS